MGPHTRLFPVDGRCAQPTTQQVHTCVRTWDNTCPRAKETRMFTAAKKQDLPKHPSTVEWVSHGVSRQPNTIPYKNGTAPHRSHTQLPQGSAGLEAHSYKYTRADAHESTSQEPNCGDNRTSTRRRMGKLDVVQPHGGPSLNRKEEWGSHTRYSINEP